MILTTKINENLIRHYSDEGKSLRHKKYGLVCAESFESKENIAGYDEVDMDNEIATIEDYKAALERLGVKFDA